MTSLRLSSLLVLCILCVLVSQVKSARPVTRGRKTTTTDQNGRPANPDGNHNRDTAVSSTRNKNDENDDHKDSEDSLVSSPDTSVGNNVDTPVIVGNEASRVARQVSKRYNKGGKRVSGGRQTTLRKNKGKRVSGGRHTTLRKNKGKRVSGGRQTTLRKNKGKQQREDRLRQKGNRKPLRPNKAERVSTMARSVEAFSISLYKEMAKANQDNFVFSPYSVFTALSMFLLGTAGPTKTELTSGLSITSPVHPAIRSYNESLDLGNGTVLAVANNLYYRSGLTLNPRFVQKLRKFYGASTEPFLPVNPESAINAWVEDRTQGKIQDFLSPGLITSQVQALLVNAVYFKGAWKNKFEESYTRPLPFFVTPSQSVNVETMIQTGKFRTSVSDPLGATVLELPYVGDEFSFFVILPRTDTNLSHVESKLTADLLNAEIASTLQQPEQDVDVQLPKFELDTEEKMRELLQGIGINQLFDSSKASLKKMTKDGGVSVNEVLHRAVIEVDEEGTVAAAATGGFVFMSLPPSLAVNRPFMFVLRDKVYGINLFLGRYTNPEGENLKN